MQRLERAIAKAAPHTKVTVPAFEHVQPVHASPLATFTPGPAFGATGIVHSFCPAMTKLGVKDKNMYAKAPESASQQNPRRISQQPSSREDPRARGQGARHCAGAALGPASQRGGGARLSARRRGCSRFWTEREESELSLGAAQVVRLCVRFVVSPPWDSCCS